MPGLQPLKATTGLSRGRPSPLQTGDGYPSHHPLSLAQALLKPHLLASCTVLVALPSEGCLFNGLDRIYPVFQETTGRA